MSRPVAVSILAEQRKMTHIVIPKIESRAKIEALIGLTITTLIALMSQKIYLSEPIPIEIFWGLALLGGFYFILEFLTYVKFYVEKMMYLKEMKTVSEIKVGELEVEIRKLGAELALAQVEAAVA